MMAVPLIPHVFTVARPLPLQLPFNDFKLKLKFTPSATRIFADDKLEGLSQTSKGMHMHPGLHTQASIAAVSACTGQLDIIRTDRT